jgi:hypothetical protein
MTLQERLKAPPADDILYEHLGYSIDLVAMALREIDEPPHSIALREWYRQMSIIEVFWGQTRILVEFFTGTLASSNTSAAEHFTKKKLQYDFAFGDENIVTMMNDQIAHMNTARTTDPGKKLKPEAMWRVGAALGRALERFIENLTDDSRKIWDIRTSGYQKINAGYVYVSQTLNASSAAPQMLQTSLSTTVAPQINIVGLEGSKQPEPSGLLGPTGPLGHPRGRERT